MTDESWEVNWLYTFEVSFSPKTGNYNRQSEDDLNYFLRPASIYSAETIRFFPAIPASLDGPTRK